MRIRVWKNEIWPPKIFVEYVVKFETLRNSLIWTIA